jgi:ABC-type multidrug transport system permease subunit
LAILLFVAVNLMVGITLSSIAKNQLQAMQMTMFYFLPNILLSGFMFPFRGMPDWAQAIGNALPLTYFLRLVRGIFLKGSSLGHAVAGYLAADAVCRTPDDDSRDVLSADARLTLPPFPRYIALTSLLGTY